MYGIPFRLCSVKGLCRRIFFTANGLLSRKKNHENQGIQTTRSYGSKILAIEKVLGPHVALYFPDHVLVARRAERGKMCLCVCVSCVSNTFCVSASFFCVSACFYLYETLARVTGFSFLSHIIQPLLLFQIAISQR